MRVIVPIGITDVNLFSSTIAEPDTGEVVWIPATVTLGEERISTVTHRVYEVVADPSTTDDPVIGVDANPPSWVNKRPTNKFAMFDDRNSTKSEANAQIIVEIKNGVVADSAAGFSIEEANLINITVTDPIDGEVFNLDIDMNDNSRIADYWDWYFTPIIRKREFVVLGLPAYKNATIKMTADGNDIKFGNFLTGTEIVLGVADFGTSLGLLDFSRKEVDTFGNTVVTPGRNSKLVNFNATVKFEDVGFVFNTLSDLTNIPSVWVGTKTVDDPTLSFGYFRNVRQNITFPTITDLTITVESLT